MSAMASQITSLTIVHNCTQRFIQAQIKENIKDPRHWRLWGASTGDRWIPHTNGHQMEAFSALLAIMTSL